jgi:hypothetical protein
MAHSDQRVSQRAERHSGPRMRLDGSGGAGVLREAPGEGLTMAGLVRSWALTGSRNRAIGYVCVQCIAERALMTFARLLQRCEIVPRLDFSPFIQQQDHNPVRCDQRDH